MAVAEAVELLGVEGEHGDAALEEGVHDGAAGHLDGDRDAAGLTLGEGGQRCGEFREGLARMRDGSLGEEASLGVEHGRLMGGGGPVDADVERVAVSHSPRSPSLLWVCCGLGRPWCVVVPCTGARGATPHWMCAPRI